MPTRAPHHARLAVGLFLAVSVTAFETLAVGTILPTIADEFDGDRLYGATFVVYMLANLIALVSAGEAADRTGLRRPFALATLSFAVGLLVAGTANSMFVVLIGRALQGAGTGIFTTTSYVAVRRAYDETQQRTMYAVLSTGWVVPSLIAPFAAGWITDTFGWRWAFIGLLPLAVVVFVLAVPALGQVDRATTLDHAGGASRVPLAIALAAGIGTLTASSYSAQWWLVVPLAVVGVAVVVRTMSRLMPAGTWRAVSGRPAAVVARMCAMAAFNGADFFIPLAARRFHDATPTEQGATILGSAVTWSIAQWYAVRRADRVGPQRLVQLGFGLLASGVIASMTVLGSGVPLWVTFIGWSIGGFGMGLLFNPTSHVAMSSADSENAGLASTQLAVADVFGFSVMAAFGGAMVSFADQTRLGLTEALTAVFLSAALVAALGVVAGRNVKALEPATA